jgi:hypothetical protein
MRSSKWLLGLSLVSAIAAVAVAMGGCGSSSSGSPGVGGSSGTGGASASTGTSGTTGTGGSSGGGTGGSADAGPACTSMGPNVATINAGPLWACFESACMTQLVACAADCACNNAVIAALQCVPTGGSQMTCFAPVITAGPTGMAVAICLFTSTSACSASPDAGSDGPEDSGADASGEGGTDAPSQGG